MNKKLAQRFIELEEQMKSLQDTLKPTYSVDKILEENVDDDIFHKWKINVKSLIVQVCGKESVHYEEFNTQDSYSTYGGNFLRFKRLKSVFLATKEDFEGGYLSSYRTIVQAEVFDTQLEQAKELLTNGYFVAAAVIAGIVLETALRELCDRKGIPLGKMDKMNADLAKVGTYNKIVQKQITHLAGIRNAAAHGNKEEFTKTHVEQMIPSIQDFLAKYLGN